MKSELEVFSHLIIDESTMKRRQL